VPLCFFASCSFRGRELDLRYSWPFSLPPPIGSVKHLTLFLFGKLEVKAPLVFFGASETEASLGFCHFQYALFPPPRLSLLLYLPTLNVCLSPLYRAAAARFLFGRSGIRRGSLQLFFVPFFFFLAPRRRHCPQRSMIALPFLHLPTMPDSVGLVCSAAHLSPTYFSSCSETRAFAHVYSHSTKEKLLFPAF